MPDQPPATVASDSHRLDAGVRLPAMFRLVWVPALVVLVAIELLAEPIEQEPMLIGLVLLTVALGVMLVLIPGLAGRRRLVLAVVGAAVLTDLSALMTPFISSSGNDTALVAPFLGALLFASMFKGRRLLALLAVQWTCGMVASWMAYTMSGLRLVPDADPLPLSLAAAAASTLVEYTVLWWVRFRLTAATARADAAAAESRSSAEALRAMIASSPLPAVVFDPDGRVRFANAAAGRWFGVPDIEGEAASAAGGESPIPGAWLERAMRGEAEPGERATLRLGGGQDVEVELHAAFERVDGRVSGLICQVVDVTEREALAERQATADRLETVGRMAGGVAHDFNNMLTAVAGHADLLLASLPAGGTDAGDAAAIREAAGRGADLVRRLLTFARRERLEPVLVDVNALVESLEPMLGRLIGGEVTLSFDLAPLGLPVLVDRVGVEQVLVNLVLNGRDAMPGGGNLRIRTAAVARGDGSDETPTAMIEVSDTGTGMDRVTLDRIFDPFFTTKPGKGTGLGLTTALSIVEGSGGSLVAESRLGEGSVFRITLPVAREAAIRAEPVATGSTALPAEVAGVRPQILVVDDEPALRTVTSRMLSARGYRVATASGAATALAAVLERPFDLVLTDMVMPDVRGPVLASQLRAAAPGLRVAYMSGYADDAPAPEDGALPVLGKPFNTDELDAFVQAALDSA